ncbi:MAG: phage portal protein [Bacteroidales bacterium]|nr:phage portal protein [Bacteroidales bacterium]
MAENSRIELSEQNIDNLIVQLTEENSRKAIQLLQRKEIHTPDWLELEKQYNKNHHLINDRGFRPDKKKDGSIYQVSRIPVALQKLASERMSELMFAIPVKRKYNYPKEQEETYKEITKAIENIYSRLRIDTLNLDRGDYLFSACEIATILYLKEEQNTKYGFDSKYKVRLKCYTPKNGDRLYPLFDDYGDMIAFSVEYKRKVMKNGTIVEQTHFDTYTAKFIYNWEYMEGSSVELPIVSANPIGKIPVSYCYREEPIYADVCADNPMEKGLVDEIEIAISDNSDVNRINAAPILAGKGLSTEGDKGGILRFYNMGENGDLKYVTWQQATESVKFQIETMLKLFFMQLQLPDLSFENLKQLGIQSGEAMKMLLTDSHLKAGHEKGRFIEMFDREANIIKAVLKLMNVNWANYLDNIEIEHEITPFMPNDESANLSNITKATGGKAVMSQREGIEKFGYSDNPEQTLKEIQEEEKQSALNGNTGMIFE